jgi:flagellar protein FlaJ
MNIELRKNLEKMKSLVMEIENVQNEMQKAKNEEKKLMADFIENAKSELKKLSSEIPSLLVEKKKINRIELKGSEKRKYLAETGIEEDALTMARKKIEKRKIMEIEKLGKATYTMPGIFTKLSSRLFSSPALKITKSAIFQDINRSLRKANMPYLISTYISIALLVSLISFFFSIFAAIALFTFIGYFSIAIVIVVPLLVFIIIMVYPASEISSIKNKIDDELPFVTMHMSAISSSGVEPSKVFSILAAYPAVKKEMRKITNMINFYGYDLTTALRTTAKTTSSERLAELLNGISSTISGGGELRNYLDKIAADSLLDYKLRRKRFMAISETYADIYTGLLIAAPLMFMLILVLMNVITGNIAGMSTTSVASIGIGAIIVMNIGFLIFLEISQPSS